MTVIGIPPFSAHTQLLGFRQTVQVQPATTPQWSSMPIHVWNLWRLSGSGSGGLPWFHRLAKQLSVGSKHVFVVLFIIFGIYVWVMMIHWREKQMVSGSWWSTPDGSASERVEATRRRELESLLGLPSNPRDTANSLSIQHLNMNFNEPIRVFNHWDLEIKCLTGVSPKDARKPRSWVWKWGKRSRFIQNFCGEHIFLLTLLGLPYLQTIPSSSDRPPLVWSHWSSQLPQIERCNR